MATTLHAKHQKAKRVTRKIRLALITPPPRTLFNSWPVDQFATKGFSLGDVLSITTGRLLSERGMQGVYDILNWMTGDNLFTHQLIRANRICRPYLLEQYPELDEESNPKLAAMVKKLLAMLSRETEQTEKDYLISGWLCSVGVNFWGLQNYDKLEVLPLSASQYQSKDPMEEAIEMVSEDRIITITVPASDGHFQDTLET